MPWMMARRGLGALILMMTACPAWSALPREGHDRLADLVGAVGWPQRTTLTDVAAGLAGRGHAVTTGPVTAEALLAARPDLRALTDRPNTARRHALRHIIRADYAGGRYRVIDGWLIADTEIWLMRAADLLRRRSPA